jgi:hypothetical protein
MTAGEREQLKILRNTVDLILDALCQGYSSWQMVELREAYCRKLAEAIELDAQRPVVDEDALRRGG